MSSETPTLLFVDDDADVLTAAQVLLGRNGWRMLQAKSPAEAWSVLAAERVDVALLDLNFSRGATSGAEGFRWLAELRAHDPEAVVVVVTGHSGVKVAVEAMKAGASDFVMKPWSNARLLDTLRDALALRRGRGQPAEPAPAEEPVLMIGESPAIARVRDRIARAAPTEAAVLIHGPAGTGKSLAAQLLHARSGRAERPLVRLDLRSLAPDAAALGRALAEAAGGTLLLDEIAALSAAAQSELLARLDRGADVRLVSTTRDLVAAQAAVRDDLMARLGVVEVHLPPLRERGEDAVLLAEHFVRLFARRYGRPPKPLDETAIARLTSEPPAGEVRGLRQAAERAVVLTEAEILTAADFMPAEASGGVAAAAPDLNLARSEKVAVEAALKRHGHNVSQAARELGLTRAALYRRMVKHGL
ncbi:MAG TPA: sigma-54 dependent transcriptional regulator [Phenylobacterium sp.]|nr:sigma-54 dependent transcriptional regulator [Phenylobacterium sp.]